MHGVVGRLWLRLGVFWVIWQIGRIDRCCQTEPNIQPNPLAKVCHIPNFVPSVVNAHSYVMFSWSIYACTCCVVDAHLSWQQESVTARRDSTVSVTCIATDLDLLDVMRVELLASDGILRTIADTATVKAPFSRIPRYDVTFNHHNSIGNLTITYQGMLLSLVLSAKTEH